ncbi:rRNA pseudouridine synthase [Candidatus Saccharibacteria bacterium]|nr:rRNA pseudouridine synthase [Candidatus Saccharibacteria bacterium]
MPAKDTEKPQSIRLNKFLAERLGLSRREADSAIAAGVVKVDDHPAVLGERIDKTSKVWYNGKIVPFPANYTYLLLYKPVGYVCSRRQQGETPTIYSILPPEYQDLKTVGRLDADSSGVILLTNDGDLAFQLTHPKFLKSKEYEVELDRPLEPLHQQMISDFGLDLPDGKSRLMLTRLDDERKKWRVEMSEGRNRQIRRTFAAVGYVVTTLKRKRFGEYELGSLKPGEFKEITKR